ncbi:MAG: betaine-aldehyde dehydrogenase, partial [Betaproteobacteria bacterium]|nr:betaine-aldehyde dehydrogenase [Betaproteobacteria bacterium]
MRLEALRVEDIVVSPDHYIDGARIDSELSFELFSPIDQGLLGRIGEGGPEHVELAVAAAQKAFPTWS